MDIFKKDRQGVKHSKVAQIIFLLQFINTSLYVVQFCD